MTKQEVQDRFRQENPEATDRVITNTVLDNWCQVADKEICARTRLIKWVEDITTIANEDTYNLTNEITNFYDIDELPGGGVVYNNKRLRMKTIAQLDQETPSWRTADSGTPNRYFRFNNMIVFDRPGATAVTLKIYAVLISNDFNDDNKLPFNEYTHLEPFHYSLVLYLTMRAKFKIGKPNEQMAAMAEYENYVKWMKTEIQRGTYSEIQLKSPVRSVIFDR